MKAGFDPPFPVGLLEALQGIGKFASLSPRHQRHIAQMLWDFANSRYQHLRYDGAAFSTDYMRSIWGNLKIRNKIVKDFFVNIQGDNHSHLMSNFNSYDFLGRILIKFLEDEAAVDFLVGEKRMRMPPKPIASRASSNEPGVTFAKHSKWSGVSPAGTIPINQEALLEFARLTTNARQKMSAYRLLKISRYVRCPGEIPVLYEQKSSGRLTEVLFGLQNTQREVLSAALSGYWDYDLNNAHFSILSQWANKLGYSTPVIDEYMKDKADIRLRLSKECNTTVDGVKEALIAVMYGAPLHTNPDFTSIPKILGQVSAKLFAMHPFVRCLKKEISTIGKFVVADTHSRRGCYVNAMGIEAPKELGKDLKTIQLLCHALQGIEALALKTVVATHGQDILLCMHDGWVARKKLDCDNLRSLIFQATGFDLQIEEKRLPKYHPEVTGKLVWPFSKSNHKKGGLIVSASSSWNTPEGVHGRVTRTDRKDPRRNPV